MTETSAYRRLERVAALFSRPSSRCGAPDSVTDCLREIEERRRDGCLDAVERARLIAALLGR